MSDNDDDYDTISLLLPSGYQAMCVCALAPSQTYTKGLLLLSSLGLPSPVGSAKFSDGLFLRIHCLIL